jgi:hypothetical protein
MVVLQSTLKKAPLNFDTTGAARDSIENMMTHLIK